MSRRRRRFGGRDDDPPLHIAQYDDTDWPIADPDAVYVWPAHAPETGWLAWAKAQQAWIDVHGEHPDLHDPIAVLANKRAARFGLPQQDPRSSHVHGTRRRRPH